MQSTCFRILCVETDSMSFHAEGAILFFALGGLEYHLPLPASRVTHTFEDRLCQKRWHDHVGTDSSCTSISAAAQSVAWQRHHEVSYMQPNSSGCGRHSDLSSMSLRVLSSGPLHLNAMRLAFAAISSAGFRSSGSFCELLLCIA